MKIVQILIGADGVHVGIDPLAGLEFEVCEPHALPLGQGVHNLRSRVFQRLHREAHRPLDAGEIIVDPGAGLHKERCRHPHQVELKRDIRLEEGLDLPDRKLSFTKIQDRLI